jgi:2-succinyl-6-hydroxy-2,4-cyclohexadiene-1-carboxylate synthase
MKAPLLLLHGFTGAPASWDGVRAQLPDRFDAFCPALAGHAGQRFDGITSFDDELARLLALLGTERRWELAGYSLGARLGLGLLARAPERFRRATLIGVHPGLDDEADRAERRSADARWARVLREQGLGAFVERWTAQPLFASQGRLPAELLAEQRARRSAQDAEGLALALERFGLGAMPSYWQGLPALRTPLTLAAGELDVKFVDLARRAARELPQGRLLLAPGAGHNLLLERPELVAQAIATETQP